MKITNQLAYSQLKMNRSRTLFALLAIVLSTALTTAVCLFVESGNAMAKSFLGSDYGAYSGTYKAILFIPALFFGAIILAMSVVVISNVFRVSANERTAQFGILKCVGATEKQIKSTVMYESIFLSLIGIPIGLAVGVLLGFSGILIANHFLDDLNDLAHMMIQEVNVTITFSISWQALLFAILISFATILFSAWRPAQKSSKCSAVDCIRGTGTVLVTKKNLRTNSFFIRISGYEGALAAKNRKRSRRNFHATTIVLCIGVILFVCLGSMSNIADQFEQVIYLDLDETVNTEYSSARIEQTNETTGLKESIYLAPIDSKLGNEIGRELSSYDGKDVYGIGLDSETYHTTISNEFILESMEDAWKASEDNNRNSNYEFAVEIITLDEKNYEKLCNQAKVPLGSNILLNNYNYNNNGHSTDIVPFSTDLKSVPLMKADGTQTEYSIDGTLTLEEIPKELLYFNTSPVRLVVSEAIVWSYSWYSDPDDISEFISYANDIMAKNFPEDTDSEYMDAGFSTRVFEMTDYMKVMNIAIVLILVFLYSFVVLLMLIGFTNVVSTISTNIMMRAREFAVLQSIGMTPEGLRKMLNWESILCSAKALLIGIPTGIMITYLISIPIKATYPIPYILPWNSVLFCSLGVLAITFGTTRIAVRRLRKQNIIETIRQESGR